MPFPVPCSRRSRSGSPIGGRYAGNALAPRPANSRNNTIKTTFCLIDWYALEGNSSTSDRTFWECQTSYQGIQSDWVDQYHQSLEGQSLDLTGIPNRNDHYLVSTVKPDGIFLETTRTNNAAWVKFRLFTQGNGRAGRGNGSLAVLDHPGLCGVGAPGR